MNISYKTKTNTNPNPNSNPNSNPNILSCPLDKPLLCGASTFGKGLCVKSEAECHIRTLENRTIPESDQSQQNQSDQSNQSEQTKSNKYGYTTVNLGRGCYLSFKDLKLDYEEHYMNFENVPNTFKLMTYNIWGLAKNDNLKKLFKLRKNLLIQTIEDSRADFLCLQEMSEFAYNELSEYIAKYKFASEKPYPSTSLDRNRSVDIYFMAKYVPKSIKVYSLPGILGYTNCMMIIEYPNLIIFNVYLQAGGISSPGQENYWIHYSRCRYDLLNIIYDIVKSSYITNDVIICGDFNCDLNGSYNKTAESALNHWTELEMIDKLKNDLYFIDTVEPALSSAFNTEDTTFNFMRWNQKLVEKHYRYDGIFYKPNIKSWNIMGTKLIGKEYEHLSYVDSKWFFENISDSKIIDQLRGIKTNSANTEFYIPINPSDHFGVMTMFKNEHKELKEQREKEAKSKTKTKRGSKTGSKRGSKTGSKRGSKNGSKKSGSKRTSKKVGSKKVGSKRTSKKVGSKKVGSKRKN